MTSLSLEVVLKHSLCFHHMYKTVFSLECTHSLQ